MANHNRPTNGFDKRPQDGNKKGRPLTYFNQILRDIGEEIEPKTGKPIKELVSKRLWAEAANGNIMAIREIMDRLDGKPLQRNEISGEDGGGIIVTIRDYGTGNRNLTTREAEGSTRKK